jgi:chromosome segregation ATPase
LPVDERQELTEQKMELDNTISELVNQQKDLKEQVIERHKDFQRAKAAIKKLWDEKVSQMNPSLLSLKAYSLSITQPQHKIKVVSFMESVVEI